jgi:CRP/FNR family cyclic AMP-dependent transcriptional regulator
MHRTVEIRMRNRIIRCFLQGALKLTESPWTEFNAFMFLTRSGMGRRIMQLSAKEAFFAQGTLAQSIYYLHKGQVKLTVVSHGGKEATIALVSAGDFFGEDSLQDVDGQRTATATAITRCTALQIDREEMIQTLHREHALSEVFVQFMLTRTMRVQADLVDQLFNSSEKRLARTLLLMARYGVEGTPEALIPPITQETLANMIGTTRSRVNFFMNRFRKLGFIEYKGRIRVHQELANVILNEEFVPHTERSSAPIPYRGLN